MSEFSDIPIGELLPQQPPFRFVDRLEHYDETVTRLSFTPGSGNLLMEDGCLCAAGVLEHMAQACAARIGYRCRYILHLPLRIGFIGQVRRFKLLRLPKTGERMETSVFFREEVFNISLMDVQVYIGEEMIASATLKTALKDD